MAIAELLIADGTGGVHLSNGEEDVEEAIAAALSLGVTVRLPMGLAMLGSSLEEPPPGIQSRVDELDAIVDGTAATPEQAGYADGTYMGRFLEHLEWWKDASEALLCGRGMESDYGNSYPEQKAKLRALIGDILDAYKDALAQTVFFQLDDANPAAHYVLLRRYRLFTRYVCAFAQEVWPEANLKRLLQQP